MGSTLSFIRQIFPPASKFSMDDIPDLTSKVMLVTGGNTGIGKETARALLKHNATVYIAGRNEERIRSAINELKEDTGREARPLKLDLADLKSIKVAAEEFQRQESQLHVLFNNGGVWLPPMSMVTANGYDLTFGTNILGHYYLTKLLLPLLISTAKSSSESKARIIHTASIGHTFVDHLDFNTFKDGPARRRKTPQEMYSQSKLATIMYSDALASRYGPEGIVSISLHPGNVVTEVQRYLSPITKFLFENTITYPVEYGALTQLYAGTSPDALEMNGKYLVPWARVGESSVASKDTQAAQELWKWLDEQVDNIGV